MRSSIFKIKCEWLKITGPDASRFLSGMWTSDIKRATDLNRLYIVGRSFLLDTKAKPVCEFSYLVESNANIIVAAPAGFGEKLKKALDHYIVADDVNIEIVDEFSDACVVLDAPFEKTAESLKCSPKVPVAKDFLFQGEKFDWGYRLPRAKLGATHDEIWLRKGCKLPFDGQILSESEYTKLRVKAGVAEWGVDIDADSLVVEFPVAFAISMNKGCYLGQETVARAIHRGRLNRAFCRVKASTNLEPGMLFSKNDTIHPVGKITTVSESEGLGLLRLQSVNAPADLGLESIEVLVDANSFG
jgi:folate-binding protein YgfZ